MACWHTTMGLGLALGLAGCADPADGGYEGSGEPTTAAAAPGGPGGGPGGGHDGDGGGPSTYSTSHDWGTSGGVEETLYGMSDDMPLVADIPDIKRGNVDPDTWVVIEQVRAISGRASLGRETWFYVQALDPIGEEPLGLRVAVSPSDGIPPLSREVDLEGYVAHDAQGWLLDLTSMVEGPALPPASTQPVRLDTLASPEAAYLDDALVEVVQPGLVVVRRGPVPGTVLVGAPSTPSGPVVGTVPTPSGSPIVLVDLRPFDLANEPQPGTPVLALRGVAELGGSRPVILPRSVDDLVLSP